MTGLKMTTMTIKEMHAARERGESKTDLTLLHENNRTPGETLHFDKLRAVELAEASRQG
jgi:hypothetical protein